MVLICSSAELCKRVGTVIPPGVDRFVGAVGLNLPDFLPGDGSSLTKRPPFPHTSRRHAYDGDAVSDNAPRPLRGRPPRPPVRPLPQDAGFCLGPTSVQEEKAGSRMPGRLLDPPAEGTTEEPMTILHSVAREPVIKCHQVEEFVSLDVVGE